MIFLTTNFLLFLFICVYAQDEELEAALKRVPQLTVRSLTPAGSQIQSIRGRTAITVVFNRAVIKLGSDWGSGELTTKPFTFEGLDVPVPGKMRWVTTSIARFDPDQDWPTDLKFKVVVKDLQTFDGSKLTQRFEQEFSTPQMGWYMVGVTSKEAESLTEKNWDGRYGYWDSSSAAGKFSSSDFEVPNDGVVTVRLHGPTDIELIKKSIRLTTIDGQPISDIGSTVEACKRLQNCFSFLLGGKLQPGQKYQLTLPKGSKYHSLSGPLQKDLTQSFVGLFPFELPFTYQRSLSAVNTRKWNMYLRHGLDDSVACDENDCTAIQSLFTVTNEKNELATFTLRRISKSTLQLEIVDELVASQDYTVKVAASSSVVDGFKQPLQASTVKLSTSQPGQLFAATPHVQFEGDAPSTITVVHRMAGGSRTGITDYRQCNGYESLHATTVTKANLVTAVSALAGLSTPSDDATLLLKDSRQRAQVDELPLTPLFGASNTVLWRGDAYRFTSNRCTPRSAGYKVVSRADLAIAAISGGHQTSVLVTKLSDNSPVAGATVTFYQYDDRRTSILEWVKGVTDVNGVAVLKTGVTINESGQRSTYINTASIVSVEANEEILLVPSFPVSLYRFNNLGASQRIVATTDRNLYKEGDVVSIKGYVRRVDGEGEVTIPSVSSIKGTIQWLRSDSSSIETFTFNVNSFGAFVGNITVPDSVDYTVLSLRLAASTNEGYGAVAINIADPRIPTGVLTLDAEQRVYPPTSPDQSSEGIVLNLATKTYTGAPLPGSKVTLQWTIVKKPSYGNYFSYSGFVSGLSYFWDIMPIVWQPRDTSEPNPTGTRELITNDEGELDVEDSTFSLTAEELDGYVVKEGDTLQLKATMIGPTRELLEAEHSLPVRSSPIVLKLDASSRVPLPGLSFSVFVAAEDADGNDVSDLNVQLHLIETTDAEAQSLGSLLDASTGKLRKLTNSGAATSCNTVTDGGRSLKCNFIMKKATKYILKATATDKDGKTIEAALPLGRTSTEWTQSPLSGLTAPRLVPDKLSYTVGDRASFEFVSPFKNAKFLVQWGNSLATKHHVFNIQSEGRNTITLPEALGNECKFGCKLAGVLIAGRDSSRKFLVNVPQSRLFDFAAPHALSMNSPLTIVDKSLELGKVAVSTDAKEGVTSPREKLEITVDVNDINGKPVASGEVHVFVVDQKVLDLAPHAVLSAQNGFKTNLDSAYYYVSDSQRWLQLKDQFGITAEQMAARAGVLGKSTLDHPWTQPRWNAQPDDDNEGWLNRFARTITHYVTGTCTQCDNQDDKAPIGAPTPPLSTSAAFTRAPSSPNEEDAEFSGGVTNGLPSAGDAVNERGGDGNAGGAASNAPPTREEPVWTPLSATAKIVNGKAVFEISSMPDNLGTFRIAALATTGVQFGKGETTVISKLKYNVEPSLPRIARVDDRFVAGVTVSSDEPASAYPIVLEAAVSVDCAFIGLISEKQTAKVELKKPGPVRVEWAFEALGVTLEGQEARLVFTLIETVDNKPKQLDRLIASLPVLPQQPEVLVATSMAVEATRDGVAWPEGIEIPEHVQNSASISVEAGVGRLPAILAFSEKLIKATESRYTVSGAAHVGALYVAPLLQAYEAQMSSELATRANAAFARATSRLRTLTLDSTLGLVNYIPKFIRPRRADVQLNLFAVWVHNQLAADDRKAIASLLPQWKSAIDFGLIDMARYARAYAEPSRFRSFDLLAEVFLVHGFKWSPAQYKEDFTLSYLIENKKQLSSAGKATLAAALLLHADTLSSSETPLVKELLQDLINQIRVQGRTAYIAYSSGSKHADQHASSRGLLALVASTDDKAARVEAPDQLIEKLANWVAAPGSTSYNRWYYPSTMVLARAAAAVLSYDVSRQNTDPDFTLRVVSGPVELLEDSSPAPGVDFKQPGQSPAGATVNAAVLPTDELVVFAKGERGEASVVASIEFTPCERERDANGKLVNGPQCRVSDQPVYRGISVEKTIRQYDPVEGVAVGKPITSAKSGTQVEVTIQITTPDDLNNVHVVDYLAAGLEAFEFAAPEVTPYYYNPRGGYVGYVSPSYTFWGWWSWDSWPVKEVRKDRVTAFAYNLRAGTSSFSYTALVVTPGKFALPPTKAYAQEQPELLGLSAGGVWGSSESAWDAVVVGKSLGVCSNDPITLLNGQKFQPTLIEENDVGLFVPRPADDPNTPETEFASSASTLFISTLITTFMSFLAFI